MFRGLHDPGSCYSPADDLMPLLKGDTSRFVHLNDAHVGGQALGTRESVLG